MLYKKIKSNIIIKLIFSFIYEKNKLKIVERNKRLQNILSIDVLNYCLWNGRLLKKVNKTGNGVIISLDSNYTLFEGKFKNGMKNGNGKEYIGYFKDLIFEGEYIDNKRNGKGKEYFLNQKLKFEGEYKNGKRNGKGVEYNSEGEIIFEGEYLNGNRWNGKGKENYCFYIFRGKYKNGKIWEGKEYYEGSNQIIFEGNYLDDKRWIGKFYYGNGNLKFDGEVIDDKLWNGILYSYDNKETFEIIDGKGKIKEYTSSNLEGILIFDGEIMNGLKNGKCEEYYVKPYNNYLNLKFEGEYLNGEKWNGIGYDINGEKQYEIKNGRGYIYEYDDYNKLAFEGELNDGIKSGKAIEYSKKFKFDGFYLNGKRHGYGKLFNGFSNILSYEGDFSFGMKNGFGREYINGALYYEGEFMNDEKNGKGKIYYSNGQIHKEGVFHNDSLIKGKIYSVKGILEEVEYNYYFNNNDSTYKHLWRGIEYEKGIIKYKGDKVNGKMWNGIGYDPMGNKAYEIKYGKGRIKKYYETGELKFDVEYLYGYIFGKGKKYYKNGKVKYDGKLYYLDNRKYFTGKKYDINGKLIYCGTIVNGKVYIETKNNYINKFFYSGKYVLIILIIFFIIFTFIFKIKN